MILWILGGVLLLSLILVGIFHQRLIQWGKRQQRALAIREFTRLKPSLEQSFFQHAKQLGKPKDVVWVSCTWTDDVRFAVERSTEMLFAFVTVQIQFEAIEDGMMDDAPALTDNRDSCAVFHYENGHWGTGGRTIFNMFPSEFLDHLSEQFELIDLTDYE